MDPGEVPLLPAQDRTRGQVAVISQSGGMGFAFFDHGRPKELSFRYIITTGNEACLTASDFAEFVVDEGKTAAILMLIEDIKSPASFERAAAKALRTGVPLIVNRLGASEAGARAIAAHTAARGDDAEYRTLRSDFDVNDIRRVLDSHYELIDQWVRYSQDKRTDGGWYLKASDSSIGSLAEPAELRFGSVADTVANYAIRELDFWSGVSAT